MPAVAAVALGLRLRRVRRAGIFALASTHEGATFRALAKARNIVTAINSLLRVAGELATLHPSEGRSG